MSYSARVFWALLLVAGCGLEQYLHALTVYRIGGNNLPPPEITAEEGVDFVQLNWEDADSKRHGTSYLLDIQDG